MVYTRCNRNDYDGWAAQGNPGWSYADLLPLFKRAENSHCFTDNEYHGNNGPLHVSYLRSPSPANEAFRSACVEKGIPLNPDYNGASQFGISPPRPRNTTASAGTPRGPTCTPTPTARTSPC
jgi:choline dehydrogenase-like flavoprotein